MKGTSDYGWTIDDFRSPSRPTPRQDAVALRWAAILAVIAGLLFGMQGGWMVFLCMALTVASVALFVLSNIITSDNQ